MVKFLKSNSKSICLYTLSLCTQLQTVNSDLTATYENVPKIIDNLNNIQCNSHSIFKEIYEISLQILNDIGLESERIMHPCVKR